MNIPHRFVLAAVVAASAPGLAPTARADIGVPYTLVETFALPQGMFDVLPDGRLLAIDGVGNVVLQNAINSSAYTAVGFVGSVNSDGFGPAFVSISPDGSTLAVGNNEFNAGNAVLFFNTAEATSGNATAFNSITTPNYAGVWADNQTLYVSGAISTSFATVVNRLDLAGGTSTTVITPAGGFSGDVAIAGGSALAGAGDSGDIYTFDLATLASASSPVSMTSGTFLTSYASAGAIDFDPFGNVIVAGGVFGPGGLTGSAAVIDPATQDLLEFTPAGTSTFYGAFFNTASNQLVVTANGTAYVYAVPAPAAAMPFVLGLVAVRRRRTRKGF